MVKGLRFWTAIAVAAVSVSAGARARVAQCTLNGADFNPNHGDSKIGKTGIVKCLDEEGKPVYERELRDGKFIGLERYYKDGILAREQHVNEIGNRDGVSREFAATAPKNRLVREERYQNGRSTGVGRIFFPNGKVERMTAYGENGREVSAVEWNDAGQLTELRCADKPVFGTAFNDAVICGHGARESRVELFTHRGLLKSRSVFAQGKRISHETYWDNGKIARQIQTSGDRRVERRFSDRGIKVHEVLWVGPERDQRKSIEQQFYDSGKPKWEKVWSTGPTPRLTIERHWYMNGRLRSQRQATEWQKLPAEREQEYSDDGKLAAEGNYLLQDYGAPLPIGVHKTFDRAGKLAFEVHYDATGTRIRERTFKSGALVRDEALFPDGSRKSYAK